MSSTSILLAFALLITACTSQSVRHDIVYFENICTEPAEILTGNSSNFYTSYSETVLGPGEKAAVASYMLYTESMKEHISDEHSLRVTVQTRSITLRKNDLLDQLETAHPKVMGSNRIWVITNKTLCPESTHNTQQKTP